MLEMTRAFLFAVWATIKQRAHCLYVATRAALADVWWRIG